MIESIERASAQTEAGANQDQVARLATLQVEWLSSLWALQTAWWRSALQGELQWPAWAAWHNGLEQLA
ncbi:MAG: hypothetical protein JSR59_23220 [Proteobacteria bacterium]|nr:hypothetical protein [Pseudomonadota bacterium]